jgi:type I restriction enzyme R subunit
VTDAGRYIVTDVDGVPTAVTVEEYKERLAHKLLEEAPTLQEFLSRWISPEERRTLLQHLPEGGHSAYVVRDVEDMQAYDLYDVLGELGYGLQPRTRIERAGAFSYKHEEWLAALPQRASATLRAIAGQFAGTGTEALENRQIFQVPEVMRAGGIGALQAAGDPKELVQETKARMFAP